MLSNSVLHFISREITTIGKYKEIHNQFHKKKKNADFVDN